MPLCGLKYYIGKAFMKPRILAGPEDTVVEKKNDVASFSVTLPSSGVFYPGRKDTIQVSLLTVSQVRQLYGAKGLTNEYNQFREIVNALGRSVQDFDILDLTYSDFEYLKYWIRLNSFRSTPYILMWEYVQENGEKKSVRSVVNMNDFHIDILDKHYSPPNNWRCMTVRDKLDIMQLTKPEDIAMAEYACLLPGRTIEEKQLLLDSYPADTLVSMRRHIDKSHHGIVTRVMLTDPDVPDFEPIPHTLVMELADFFP